MPRAYIGVDVGTTSARAGVFDEAGTLLATAKHPIRIWHEAGDIVEQSSPDIWDACVGRGGGARGGGALCPPGWPGALFPPPPFRGGCPPAGGSRSRSALPATG